MPTPEADSPEPSGAPGPSAAAGPSDPAEPPGISGPPPGERPDPADTAEVHTAPPPGAPHPVFSPWESLPHHGPSPAPPPFPVAAAPPADGFSVAALVFGILSIVLCWAFGVGIVLGILALVFGPTGLRRAARSGAGLGRAMAGIITGAIGMALSAVVFIGLLIHLVGAVDCDSPNLTGTEQVNCADHGTPYDQ